MDLSVLIPSRNEIFLKKTIEDILENIEGNTEVIAVLDGYWADPPIIDNPKVILVHFSESVGQRAATNVAARISQAKYLMKVDAHCAFDKGFDVKMMDAMHDNWTMAPTMRNLHAFDWVCENDHRRYQGPSGPCTECGKPTTMDIVWIAKRSPQSNSYCFDSEPHFQYFGDYNKRPEGRGSITESMSLQGSCFMLTRDKYFELNICDEKFGSWGSQGIEVSVKTWLSGGKVMINHNTWYAHMFRTQGGDFSFPYPLSGNQVSKAKKSAKDLFFENKWDKQIYPLSWLVEKFWPVPGWSENDLEKVKKSGENFKLNEKTIQISRQDSDKITQTDLKKCIVYYTDNLLDPVIASACQAQIKKSGLPIISCSLKKIDFGDKNIHFPSFKRGYLSMFKQILAGLEHSDADVIFLCEHDVLYHKSHFDFIPPKKDRFYYNTNVWRARYPDGHAVWTDDLQQVSGICVYREFALDFYRKLIKDIEQNGFNGHYEPNPRENWRSEFPNLDIRHERTLTKSKWSPEEFRNKKYAKGWKESDEVPYWGIVSELFDKIKRNEL